MPTLANYGGLHRKLTPHGAKEALNLELIPYTCLKPVFEELHNLKAVWTTLSGIWGQIGGLRGLVWAMVQLRKLRQQIDGLLLSMKEILTRIRQYTALKYVQDMLRGLLKSEALKDQHWKQLFKVLMLSQISLPMYVCLFFFLLCPNGSPVPRMTLGHVYDMDLKKNELLIKDVIIQAQGEVGGTLYQHDKWYAFYLKTS
jgi:dynein heavy chain 1